MRVEEEYRRETFDKEIEVLQIR